MNKAKKYPRWTCTFEQAKQIILDNLNIIRNTPGDGTFDQDKAMEMADEEVFENILGYCRLKNYAVAGFPFSVWVTKITIPPDDILEYYDTLTAEELFIILSALQKPDIYELYKLYKSYYLPEDTDEYFIKSMNNELDYYRKKGFAFELS